MVEIIRGIPFYIDDKGRMELSPYATAKQKQAYDSYMQKIEHDREVAELEREREMLSSTLVTVILKENGKYQIKH